MRKPLAVELTIAAEQAKEQMGIFNEILVGRNTHPLFDEAIHNPSEYYLAMRGFRLYRELCSLVEELDEFEQQCNWTSFAKDL